MKRAVLEIANIDHLGKMVEHAETVSQDLLKDSSMTAGLKGKELKESFEFCQQKITDLTNQLNDKKVTKDKLDETLSIARQNLGEISSIQKDIELRDQYEKRAQTASLAISTARNEIYRWALKTGPALMIQAQLELLKSKIKEAKENDVLPPPFKPEALSEILSKEVCICGRDLKNGSDSCKHVEELLNKFNKLSEIGTMLSELNTGLGAIYASADQSEATISSAQERIKINIEEEKSAMQNFQAIKNKLIGSDDANIAFVNQKYESTQSDMENILKQIGSLETQIKSEEDKLSLISKQIQNEAALNQKSKESLHKANFAAEVLNVARDMYKNLSDQVRSDVATNLNNEFQSMIWKKNFFKPVEIDENYKVLVYNIAGIETRAHLSAGETACLAFAFSLTLSKVAGFSYPMVIDSPLGRLDDEVKEFVSGVLTKALNANIDESGNQILMLMTDSEYNDDVAGVLKSINPKVMEIVFDEKEIETRLVDIK